MPAPGATSVAATDVTAFTATLNGRYDCLGSTGADPVTVTFEWGPTVAYGNTVIITTTATGIGTVDASTPLSGLTGNTTYYFQITATNSFGTVEGGQLNFTTLFGQPPGMVF